MAERWLALGLSLLLAAVVSATLLLDFNAPQRAGQAAPVAYVQAVLAIAPLGEQELQLGRHLPESAILALPPAQRQLPPADGADWRPVVLPDHATREAGHWRLSGHKQFVLDGHVAQALLVVARSAGAPGHRAGLSLFLVDPATPGLRIERQRMVDSRNAATLLRSSSISTNSRAARCCSAWKLPMATSNCTRSFR